MTTTTPKEPPTAVHEPRLDLALRSLLQGTRVAALGTRCADGSPLVSMVPFAVVMAAPTEPAHSTVGPSTSGPSTVGRTHGLVLHVSGLAAHTANLERSPEVSLMVMQAEVAGEPVHALPRVSFAGRASVVAPDTPDGQRARAAYLARFAEAEPMTALPDFRFVWVELLGARQVAGFGAARSLDADAIRRMLAPQ